MGTHAATYVHDEEGKLLVTILRSQDGYPRCHGAALAEFFKGKIVVNGNPAKSRLNGMGEVAAKLIEFLLKEGHRIYIVAEAPTCNYEYTIKLKGWRGWGVHVPGAIGDIEIEVGFSDSPFASEPAFEGTPEELGEWSKKEENN